MRLTVEFDTAVPEEMDLFKILQRSVGNPATTRLSAIDDKSLDDLEAAFDAALCIRDERSRNRSAIELHTKLDRLSSELEADPNASQADKDRASALTDRLLTAVFNINPAIVKP